MPYLLRLRNILLFERARRCREPTSWVRVKHRPLKALHVLRRAQRDTAAKDPVRREFHRFRGFDV